MNISVFGLGYVGCVSLGCLAKNGHRVIGVDVIDVKVASINQGSSPIVEAGLSELIAEGHALGSIRATHDVALAVSQTDVSLICVGTPSAATGHLDLSHVEQTVEQIGKALASKEAFHVVAIRSTIIPGTSERLSKILASASGKQAGRDFAVVANPEFLREGSAIADYFAPPYTLVGSNDVKGSESMRGVYAGIDAPFIVVDVKVAEMIKLVNNSFHALKVTFGNEVGRVCKELGVDSHELMGLFLKDTKLNVSPAYLMPGFAYGGSCLPKDLEALKSIAHDRYVTTPVLNAISSSNKAHIERAISAIFQWKPKSVGLLGLSFKKGTDDLRNSPLVDIAEALLAKGLEVRIYDESVSISRLVGSNKSFIEMHLPHLSRCLSTDADGVVKASDVVVVGHREELFETLLANAKDKKVLDLVRMRAEVRVSEKVALCW
jgi:GDP-mannose 6-dehydrogenase